jgi:predicted NAD/FAD-dependent oxidoreductase
MFLLATSMAASPRVAVIGGGISGLSCAARLRALGIDATVFDTGKRAPGGRASSREILLPGAEHALAADHAVQFFTATGAFAEEVRAWEAAGVVRRWDSGVGLLSEGAAFEPFADGRDRWIGVNAMADVSRHLASQCARIEQDVRAAPRGSQRARRAPPLPSLATEYICRPARSAGLLVR